MKTLRKPSGTANSAPHGVLARCAVILEAIASHEGGLSLTRVMRLTGLSNATSHRLLGALVDIGYLSVDDATKTYTIAPRLRSLLHVAHPRAEIATLALPALQSLVARFGETAFAARLNGLSVETVATISPDNRTQSYVQPGRVMPINAAASAKAIFAYQPKDVVAQALRDPLEKYTQNTIVSRTRLMREFESVRRQGFAVCADELDHGVLSYACPVDLAGTGTMYSVGVVALSKRLERFDRDQIVAALQAAAGMLASRFEPTSPRLQGGLSIPQPVRGLDRR
jgi:DNA-binding IclR family transcriptional regulator